MLNQIVLVGRLAKELEIKEDEKGKKVCNILLAVPRSYKNEEGIYETDFIECILYGTIAENTIKYCNKGDVIGVKGRMESNRVEQNDGTFKYEMQVIAEKITFLSSRSQDADTE